MRDLQEGGLVGCTAARNSTAENDGVCKYVAGCDASKDKNTYEKVCSQGGRYCIKRYYNDEDQE